MQQSSGLQACNFIKKRLQNECFSANIPKVLATVFYGTTPVAAFELCFSIRKNFFKKKVSWEIAFELNSLFHVQIQEPKSMSTTTRAFVFLAKFLKFYYRKIFETRSRWRPSLCMVECSHCGLSITGDIKIYQCYVIKR